MSCLPEYIQKQRHTDWVWPLSYIPRRWTSFCFAMPPHKVCGNAPYSWISVQPDYPIAPDATLAFDGETLLVRSMHPAHPIGQWSIQSVFIYKWRIPCYITFSFALFGRRVYFNAGLKPDVTYPPNNWHWGCPEFSLTFNKLKGGS